MHYNVLKSAILKFQFLIGRLATLNIKGGVVPRPNAFQFLIGRLATSHEIFNKQTNKKFQFLIGRLATIKKLFRFLYNKDCFNSL